MVLYHVTHLTCLVEIAPATFDTDRFSDGDLDMGNMILIPLSAENWIGKAQRQEVLHGLFTKIMIDTINLLLGEVLTHLIVDGTR